MCGISLLVRLLQELNGFDVLVPPESTESSEIESTEASSSLTGSTSTNHADNLPLESFMKDLNRRIARRGPDHHGILRVDYTLPTITALDTSLPYPSGTLPFLEIHGHLLSMRDFLTQPIYSYDTASSVDRALVWNGEVFKSPFLEPVECLKSSAESRVRDQSDTKMVFQYLNDKDAVEALSQIEGPWAMVHYCKQLNCIYFGRDPRGRRSLMIGKQGSTVLISSIPWRQPGIDFEWREVDTRGVYKLDLNTSELSLTLWPERGLIPKREEIVSPPSVPKMSDDIIIKELMDVLRESVRRRVHFRGDHVHMSPEMNTIYKAGSEGFVFGDLSTATSPSESIQSSYAPIAVLFSGGLDSTVLAALVDKELPMGVPIDLINVAFGNEKQTSTAPDRLTCLDSYEDLRRMSPDRPWRLILVDITKAELDAFMPEIASLMYPNNTVMDISISAPLWFASRGVGHSTVLAGAPYEAPLVLYKSTAKVLILGSGADEQFAGYGRHRVCFKRFGWQALQDELDLDIKRLWKRNLGRDDRVISDHGKEARFPYLDADVMTWIATQYLSDLCDMSLPPGVGDKRALRLVASTLGLTRASVLPKRAIQFGTKITKQMPKGKGTDNFEM